MVDTSHLYGFDKATGTQLWRYAAPSGTTIGPALDVGRDHLMVGAGPWGGGAVPGFSTVYVNPGTGASSDVNGSGGDGWVVGSRDRNYVVERLHRGGAQPTLPLELSYEHVDFFSPEQSWSARIFVQWTGRAIPPSPSLGYFVYQAGQGPLLDAAGQPAGLGNALRAYLTTAPPTGKCSGQPLPVVCPGWTSPVLDGTTATSPVLADRGLQVFTGTDAGTVYAIDGAPLEDLPPGTILWSSPVGAAVTQAPALANGLLYVPTADGDLVALDAATGAVLWTAATGSSIDVQPAVAGGVVFTGSADGTLHAFDAAGCGSTTCTALWTDDTGTAAISGAPAVAQSQLFVGTADGRLLAYGLPD